MVMGPRFDTLTPNLTGPGGGYFQYLNTGTSVSLLGVRQNAKTHTIQCRKVRSVSLMKLQVCEVLKYNTLGTSTRKQELIQKAIFLG